MKTNIVGCSSQSVVTRSVQVRKLCFTVCCQGGREENGRSVAWLTVWGETRGYDKGRDAAYFGEVVQERGNILRTVSS